MFYILSFLMTSIYDFTVKNWNWFFSISDLKWKPFIVANISDPTEYASSHSQIRWLNSLYDKYHSQWLEILWFNTFRDFLWSGFSWDLEFLNFGNVDWGPNIEFLRFPSISVNWDDADPFFKYLKDNSPKELVLWEEHIKLDKELKKSVSSYKNENDILWHFTKFLIDKNWKIILRVSPLESPLLMEPDIQKILE